MEVRTRFAPSPTGRLHIGGARTTLFAWLFARKHKGKFVLRIEDTDKERSKKEFEDDIIESLEWLGLDWDEFYRQSDRIDIYKKYLEQLLEENRAYYCFCTKEELEGERQSMVSAGLAPKYSGKCGALAKEQAMKRVLDGNKFVIRFRVKETNIVFKDIIRGSLKFDMGLAGDVVIAKDVLSPLYNFAVVVDDALMRITHVIRGEEHIANTPKQILLAEALGFESPQFAHVPLILNPDRSKMSKRFMDVSIIDYRKDGYLPDAIVNFIAFLGWHPKGDRDIMTRAELIDEFDLERVQKAGAVFNIDKLNWLNASYINKLSSREFMNIAQTYLPPGWVLNEAMALSVRGRIKKMSDVKALVDFYFDLPDYPKEMLRWKDMDVSKVPANLSLIMEIVRQIPGESFDKNSIEKLLIEKTREYKKGEIFWPLRVAISGSEFSPTPFEMMEALGKEESLRRIELAINKSK